MCMSDYDDAKQRIETVVSEYRNGKGKDNYTWDVKQKYRVPTEIMIMLAVAAFFSLNMIGAGWKGGFDVVAWCIIAFFILAVAYQIVTRKIARFQEKVWQNDIVSDDDILSLCENPLLKVVIRKHILNKFDLTYTALSDYRDELLGELETLHKTESRERLIQKIDEI